ncbi:MAG: sensor histidine kinase, partial [Myxococcota bacterium]
MLHPILKDRRRLFLYLVLWVGIGKLLAVVLVYGGRAPLDWAVLFALPLSLLLGFQSLGSWYLVRSLPGETTPILRLLVSWGVAGAASVGVWVGIGLVWASLLLPASRVDDERRREILLATAPVLLVVGFLGFVAAVLGHYMLVALERSREAERRALELQVLARESELRSLKAQLDPHFLFNSLNSVAALIGTDAPAARRMCFLMAGFFRKSLGLAKRDAIPLSEEIYLAETFLAIEEVRFGERLR